MLLKLWCKNVSVSFWREYGLALELDRDDYHSVIRITRYDYREHPTFDDRIVCFPSSPSPFSQS
jgi:hypothetical protein